MVNVITNKWYEKALRRNVVNIMIPDWNEEFVTQYDAEQIKSVDTLIKGGM